MHKPRMRLGSDARDGFGASRLYGFERLATAFEQDTNQIDHDSGITRRGSDRFRTADIGLHRMDLPDPPHRLQMTGQFGPSYGHPDAKIRLGKRAHNVPAKKTGTAENGNECVVMMAREHA
jgi:hypothetical protein